MVETTYCPRHPKTATNLRCGKCDDLICAQCLVHTPVGARCKDCAQVRRSPIYDVSGRYLARAIGMALGLGIVGGAVAGIVALALFGGLFFLALMGGLGYIIGEGVSLAANRKRGRTLQYIAAGGMLVAGLAMLILLGAFDVFTLLGIAVGVFIAVSRLR